MPIHEYICPEKHITEKFSHGHRPSYIIKCERCNLPARKMVSRVNTDLTNNERYSNSMGVNPRQIPEAERLYPGSRYTPDGRLIVMSRKDKLRKIKQRNLIEF